MVASIGQISKDTGGQMKTVDSVKDVAAKVIDQISSINANVNTQASFVEQTSASMQEMAASIASVAAVTERADGLSADLVRVSREGAEAMGDLAEAIKAIEAASNQVLGIVGILTAIASQTDLLSMNAAIEAAHAGDSGRGFAVVAGEIRRLAEDSRVQAAEIAACVDDMLKKVTRGVELSAGAQASFQKIDQDIVETTGLIREIAHATVEQRSSTSEILNSIGSVVRATEGVRSIASALKGMGEEIAASMEELYGVSAHIDLAAKEQSQGNQQIVSLVTNVREVSRRNVDIVERLKSTIERFAFEAGQAQA
jgi:methyl-accepting chemotaxis protein